MKLPEPTPDDLAITSLVTSRERLERAILLTDIEREQLEWYLIETLGDDWKRDYYLWRQVNAEELKEHRAEIESEYR